MSEPEHVWAFPHEKRRGGRGWMIGLIIAGVVLVVTVVLLLIWRPWAAADPAPSPSVSTSATPSATPTESATPTPTPTNPTTSPAPTATATPPARVDPSLPVFRGKVQPLLDDAETGLSYASDSSGQEGVQLVDQLQGDAGRMADAVAPSSIAAEWSKRVNDYGASLGRLRTAFEQGSATSSAISSAQGALDSLNSLISP